MDEFQIWIISAAGAAGAVLVFFIYNLACTPYRVERDRRKQLQTQLAEAQHVIAKLSYDPRTDAEKDEIYDGSHRVLRDFCNEHITLTTNGLYGIATAIIDENTNNPALAEVAKNGLRHSFWLERFSKGQEVLSGLSFSPSIFIPFDDMVKAVDGIEKEYRYFVQQIEELAEATHFDVANHPRTADLWTEWRKEHQRLIDAYEPIKKESRMRTSDKKYDLHRPSPKRISRWGRLVPLSDVSIGSQFLLPQDTQVRMLPRTHPD